MDEPPASHPPTSASGLEIISGPPVAAGSALTEAPSYPYPGLHLAKTKRQIRLLHLAPGFYRARLRGKLEVVDLDSNPRYEAVSYAWGERTLGMHIRVNDTFEIPITDNLYDGLRRLRYRFSTRVLWIDAICINQCDLAERGHQVSFMGDIYGCAARVCVWLGGVGRPARVKDHLARLKFRLLQPNKIRNVGWRGVPGARRELWTFLAETLASVLKSSQPAWHMRAWVYLEVVRAREVVWCYYTFAITVSPQYFEERLHDAKIEGLQGFTSILNHAFPRSRPETIQKTHQREAPPGLRIHAARANEIQAKDLRDKVYSLLSLIPHAEARLIYPDYSKPCSQVFAEATFAAIAGSAKPVTKIESLPSWAYNFEDIPDRQSTYGHLWPDSSLDDYDLASARPSLKDHAKLLRLDGLVLDTIDKVYPNSQPEGSHDYASLYKYRPFHVEGATPEKIGSMHSLQDKPRGIRERSAFWHQRDCYGLGQRQLLTNCASLHCSHAKRICWRLEVLGEAYDI